MIFLFRWPGSARKENHDHMTKANEADSDRGFDLGNNGIESVFLVKKAPVLDKGLDIIIISIMIMEFSGIQ